MNPRYNCEWDDFMENLLSSVSEWIDTAPIPPSIEKALLELFRQLNFAKSKDTEATIKAKHEAIYQCFMRPMINAISLHLRPLRIDDVRKRITLAIESMTNPNFDQNQRTSIASSKAIVYATQRIGKSLPVKVEALENQYGS
jgi:hypothetical protein